MGCREVNGELQQCPGDLRAWATWPAAVARPSAAGAADLLLVEQNTQRFSVTCTSVSNQRAVVSSSSPLVARRGGAHVQRPPKQPGSPRIPVIITTTIKTTTQHGMDGRAAVRCTHASRALVKDGTTQGDRAYDTHMREASQYTHNTGAAHTPQQGGGSRCHTIGHTRATHHPPNHQHTSQEGHKNSRLIPLSDAGAGECTASCSSVLRETVPACAPAECPRPHVTAAADMQASAAAGSPLAAAVIHSTVCCGVSDDAADSKQSSSAAAAPRPQGLVLDAHCAARPVPLTLCAHARSRRCTCTRHACATSKQTA